MEIRNTSINISKTITYCFFTPTVQMGKNFIWKRFTVKYIKLYVYMQVEDFNNNTK